MTTRPWHAPLLFFCILATAVAGGWVLHARNREQALRDFQERQLHEITTVAAVVETGLAGAARTARLVAAVDAGENAAALRLLDRERECVRPPCASAITLFDGDGLARASAIRPVALDEAQIGAAVSWSRDPQNARHIRSTIARSASPALVLIAARAAGGFVAEEVSFDSLFASAHPSGQPAPASSLLVVNGAGDVMFRTGHPEMRLNNLFTRGARCATCHQSLDHVDRMIAMQRGLLQYTVRDTPRLAAVAPIAFEGETWTAAVIAPAAGATAVLTSELQQFGTLSTLTLIGFGIAMHMTWRDRQRRIEAGAEAARRTHLEQNHSALRMMNARLESAAEEWRLTVDTIDAAVLVLDPAGAIERMNRVAADLLPGPAFSWLGKSSALLAEIPPWDSALSLACDAIERNAVSMARVRVRSTGATWDLWCRAPRRHDARRSVVVVARDVTALVELQASVRRSETMAALGLVVAGVAHEVRNPLFAISSLVDAWALQPQTAPARLVDALRGEVVRLKTLMTELLEYGSASAAELAHGRLAPVVDEAVAACRLEFESRNVRIEASVPDDLQIWMDTRRLMRVFINLLENAVQHAPQGTAVTLSARAVDDNASDIALDVCDEGPGFAAEDLPRLFTPFFSRRAGGFGLGLAICERIVGEHGGRLFASNRPSGGAMLTVTLPLGSPPNLSSLCNGDDLC